MTHNNAPIVRFGVLVIALLASQACILTQPSTLIPSEAAPSVTVATSALSESIPTSVNKPSAPTQMTLNKQPTVTQMTAITNVPVEPPPSNAAACDRLSFIEVSVGEARGLTYTESCTAECSQTITFKNTHPTERIKLIFFETIWSRPDQAGWTGERWYPEILGPGESVDVNQYNRTPHTDACPWSTRDFSLVGAIPLGADCSWVEENPATSLLPLQEVENQCR